MRKSSFLTFCFAFIPGAGQMYLGYMKRGISIMGTLLAICTVCWILPIFAWFLPLVWFASFFDTFNIANKIRAQIFETDDYIFNTASLQNIFGGIASSAKRNRSLNKFVGISAILVGAYVLFDNVVLSNLFSILYNLFPEIYDGLRNSISTISRSIPTLAISILIIYIGLKLVKGPSRQTPDEDFIEFKGDAEQQEDEENAK